MPAEEYARQGFARLYAPPTGAPDEGRPTAFTCQTVVPDRFFWTFMHVPGAGKGLGSHTACLVRRAMNFVVRLEGGRRARRPRSQEIVLEFTTFQPTRWGVILEGETLPDLQVGPKLRPLKIAVPRELAPGDTVQLFVYLKEMKGKAIAPDLSYFEVVGWFDALRQE